MQAGCSDCRSCVMLCSIPVFGYIVDRLDRVTIVALVMAIAVARLPGARHGR